MWEQDTLCLWPVGGKVGWGWGNSITRAPRSPVQALTAKPPRSYHGCLFTSGMHCCSTSVYYIYSIHIFRDMGGGFLILGTDFEKCGNITAHPFWPVILVRVFYLWHLEFDSKHFNRPENVKIVICDKATVPYFGRFCISAPDSLQIKWHCINPVNMRWQNVY